MLGYRARNFANRDLTFCLEGYNDKITDLHDVAELVQLGSKIAQCVRFRIRQRLLDSFIIVITRRRDR